MDSSDTFRDRSHTRSDPGTEQKFVHDPEPDEGSDEYRNCWNDTHGRKNGDHNQTEWEHLVFFHLDYYWDRN